MKVSPKQLKILVQIMEKKKVASLNAWEIKFLSQYSVYLPHEPTKYKRAKGIALYHKNDIIPK